MNRIFRTTGVAIVVVAVIAELGTPADAQAQQGTANLGAWRIEPTVGIWRQHDRGPATGRRIGQLVGLGFSRQIGPRAHFITSLGYYRLGEALELQTTAQGQPRTEVYDSEFIPITAGAAADLWQGAASAVSLGLELGAVWGRDRFARSTGPASLNDFPRDDWTPAFLAAPSLGLRRSLADQLDLTATGRLLLGFGDFTPTTIPAIALGLGYRF